MAESKMDRVKTELEILGFEDGEVPAEEIFKVSERLGFFPYSVQRVKNDAELNKVVSDARVGEYTPKKFKNDPSHRSNVKLKGSKVLANGLSRFNPAVAERLIKFYTKEGDIILTPYGSFGVISIMAGHMNRKGIVNELVPSYAKHIQSVVDGLNNNGSKGLFKKHYDVDVHCGNANDMPYLEDNSVDYVITSPPFWTAEKYESTDGQLSDIDDYEKFLVEYDKCNKEIFRVMKPGGICIFVVNDLRSNGKFIRFAKHTEESLERAGFETWDIGINFLYSTPGVIGANKSWQDQRLIKAHEYFVIMKKPIL